MNFKELFREYDESILKKSPYHWVIGWHIFIPIILVLALFGIGLSYVSPVRLYEYSNLGEFGFVAFFLGFISLLVFILFVIRQIRYNSSRIHHRLPFVRSNTNYFSFVVIIFLLSLVPMVPIEFYNFRVNQDVNSRTDHFKRDMNVLNRGVVFFNKHEYRNQYNSYDFGRYYSELAEDNVKSLTDKELIAAFVDVANRFDIALSETDPDVIYHRSFDLDSKYFSYLIDNNEFVSSLNGYKNVYTKYDYLVSNYNKHVLYELHEEGLLYFLIYFALGFAFLLWIFVSVPAVEFGLSVLWAVLISILVGILIGISYAMDNSDGFARGIFYFAVLVIFILAFSGNKKNRFTSIMKILSQVLIPGLVFMLFMEYHECFLDYDSYYRRYDYYDDVRGEMRDAFWLIVSFTIPIITIASVFIYKHVYGKKRLLP